MTLDSASITETGYQRPTNEDRFINEMGLAVFGVADGIGGLPFGAQAAECAAYAIREAVRQNPASSDVIRITNYAHQAVRALSQHLSPDIGIGTTLTVGLIRGDRLNLAHVGDSRCYRLRDNTLECLTEDDTVEIESRRRRARGESVVIHESDRHTLTRCLGQPGNVIPRLRTLQICPDDRYLFTTDGITRLVPDSELETMLRNTDDSLQQTLQNLVEAVLDRGAPDNATAVLVRVKGTE